MNWQPGISLEEMEREIIITALRFYHWNRTKTAESLQVSVRTIQNKIAQYIEEGFLSKQEQEPFKVEMPEEEPEEEEVEEEIVTAPRRGRPPNPNKRILTLRNLKESK